MSTARILAVFGLATVSALTAAAQKPQNDQVLVSGYGVGARKSCAAFVREADDKDIGKVLHSGSKEYYPSQRLYSEWLSGFLTAQSLLREDANIAAGHNANDLLSWIRTYCRDKPLDLFATAALKLL